MKCTTRAQAFLIDYVVSLVLFIIVLISGVLLIANLIPNSAYDDLYRENVYVTNKLLEPGFPSGWNVSNVLIPGFTQNGRINTTQLDEFLLLSYDEVKSYLQLSGEYLVVLKNSSEIIPYAGDCGFGFGVSFNITTCEPDFSSIDYDNLIKNSRLVIYEGRIISFEVYSWS